MSITENSNRIGCFTSSEIHKLMSNGREKGSFGKPFYTYVQEKKFELKLKRSINTEASTRPMLWGSFLESRVHDMLGMQYRHVFDETLKHPKYPYWSGSPDFINDKDDVVSDSKCPQPKAFCELVENCSKGIESFKENHPEYYWQLVSNALITGKNNIELIVYMPYESELEEIRNSVENADLEEPWKYRFITESLKCELAYLPDNSDYKNLNIFRLELNKSDALLLEQRVVEAGVLLCT
ncbi:MAG: hypothetical protein EKK64_07950 [Neisseriaceae bacterium]|nr:MAG: hypothetical protein EKK64_07950 [Neisseriaceae bacterium]